LIPVRHNGTKSKQQNDKYGGTAPVFNKLLKIKLKKTHPSGSFGLVGVVFETFILEKTVFIKTTDIETYSHYWQMRQV